MNLPAQTWIAWGADPTDPSHAPAVVTLTENNLRHFRAILGLNINADVYETANQSAFGRGRTKAIPANDVDCLNLIAAQYAGAWAVEVKGLCAKILLGRTFQRPDQATPAVVNAKKSPPLAGGKRARLNPVAPIQPAPQGAVFGGN